MIMCALGRVENCKCSQNQMSQCFFNGFWCIENERNFFLQKQIFPMGGNGPEIWDLSIFSDFCTFFGVAKN